MSEEEFKIQCEQCGTIYIDLEEVCPYCGRPQPGGPDAAELPPAEALPPGPSDLYPDDLAPEYAADALPPEDAYSAPVGLPRSDAYEDDEPFDPAPLDPFEDDDIFAVADQDWFEPQGEVELDYADPYDEVEAPYRAYDEPGEYDELEPEEAVERPRRRRIVLGCLGTFICIGLFYGGLGLLGAYHGLQERVEMSQVEAQTHFERGQELLAEGSLELAIAELERALSLNPNFLAAREALRDAQRISQSRPTPTSETRSAAAAQILAAAEAQLARENWTEAVETLAQVRGLDPDFQPERVSELLFTANYQLGLDLVTPDQVEEAVVAFERALSERPDDAAVIAQLEQATLYIEGKAALETDPERAVEAFSRLSQAQADYLDVDQRLFRAYEAFGDALLNDEAWCRAETQYAEALRFQPNAGIQAKAETSAERCQAGASAQATRPPSQPQARITPTARSDASLDAQQVGAPITPTISTGTAPVTTGSILYSDYNPNEARWEILSIPAGGGSPRVLVANGTMPSVSPNGQFLVYHSELIEAEGFHLFDLTTGEDRRITVVRQHILPRWGSDNNRFLFVAQELATNRWLIQLGFVDAKSDPLIVRDGRTPDWSPDGRLVAYQGADPEGNNPGIYIVPFNGGQATRLTNHESDRSPDFSPDGSRLVYMSTRSGNWDIYTVSAAGSAPRQLTTAPGNDGLPVWSPNGSQIAYVSDADGSWAIYIVNAAGGPPAKVTGWDGSQQPDWLLSQIWWAR
jgi:tetratricopeptide (TPR) repeat protein